MNMACLLASQHTPPGIIHLIHPNLTAKGKALLGHYDWAIGDYKLNSISATVLKELGGKSQLNHLQEFMSTIYDTVCGTASKILSQRAETAAQDCVTE